MKLLQKKIPACAVVIVAAGKSNRMQGTDKITAMLDGRPLIAHTISVFQSCPFVSEIVVVGREDNLNVLEHICQEHGFDKVTMIVPGGETRVHSVINGLNQIRKDTPLVAIHDGARPLVTETVIEEAMRGACRFHAAAPAIPVKDTIKSAKNRIVTDTPDRSALFAVQTPQVFDFDLLRGALQKAQDNALSITDDCSAVEALGMSVYLSQGSEENIKVTTPADLVIAEALLKNRRCI